MFKALIKGLLVAARLYMGFDLTTFSSVVQRFKHWATISEWQPQVTVSQDESHQTVVVSVFPHVQSC